MSLAKEINKKLDEIIDIKAELIKLKKELSSGAEMTNIQTGKPATKEDAVKVVEGMIADLEAHLAKLTNNGQNVRGIFNNEFYINDVLQDKQIIKELEKKKPQINTNKTKRNKTRKKPNKDIKDMDWNDMDEWYRDNN
jgi:hypothetical protein